MKQRQNRPSSRAPHGSPNYDKQFGFWCTERMHRAVKKAGGSAFVREAVATALKGARR